MQCAIKILQITDKQQQLLTGHYTVTVICLCTSEWQHAHKLQPTVDQCLLGVGRGGGAMGTLSSGHLLLFAQYIDIEAWWWFGQSGVSPTQKKRDISPMLCQCWASVADTTLYHGSCSSQKLKTAARRQVRHWLIKRRQVDSAEDSTLDINLSYPERIVKD